MSDDRLRDATTRASQAYDLLNNELLKECFESLQNSYLRLWQFSDPKAVEDREKIFIAWHVVGKVQDQLRRMIDNGKLAQLELNDLIRQQENRSL